jgi:hypothetical protein
MFNIFKLNTYTLCIIVKFDTFQHELIETVNYQLTWIT